MNHSSFFVVITQLYEKLSASDWVIAECRSVSYFHPTTGTHYETMPKEDLVNRHDVIRTLSLQETLANREAMRELA